MTFGAQMLNWDSLKHAFPVAGETNSKFLLTSRNKEVLSHADRRGYSHDLKCLNDEDSWKLFQKIAFLQENSSETTIDAEKEELGMEMVRRCAGLPLAITIMGGILATKSSLYEWKMVFENFKSYLKKGKGLSTEDVLALSYDDLPPCLRPCFLYLSVFPEDYEIDAERLIQLWVAEGFVSSDGGEMMEDVAEAWLVELVERCMVQVGKRGPSLKIQNCRMHDLMRDMCLLIAKRENFVCIIEDPSISVGVRRVVVHQSIPFVCIRSCPLRSILFFADPFDSDALYKEFLPPKLIESLKEEDPGVTLFVILMCFLICWKEQGCWTYLFNHFKMLRVLEFQGFSSAFSRSTAFVGCKLPNAIGNLIHLRFLNLSGFDFISPRIPSSLGNLRCLQTLDLRIDGFCGPYVPDVIWKLEQLRHLYLPYEMNSKTRLKLHTLRNLLTLIGFNTKNCFMADLSKLINLRKLEMCVYQKDLDENLPIIASKYLQSLSISYGEGVIDPKLLVTVSRYLQSFSYGDGGIDPKLLAHLLSSCVNVCELTLQTGTVKLPEYHYFSSNTTYISFYMCVCEEDPMPTLEKLPNLRILKFWEVHITRKEMVCSAPHFPKLESLIFKGIRNLEEWKVEEGAMATLRRLKISDCESLKMLPDGLRSITTLQELKIKYMPKQFKDKMVEGGEDFYKVQHVPSIIFSNIDGE